MIITSKYILSKRQNNIVDFHGNENNKFRKLIKFEELKYIMNHIIYLILLLVI